MSIHINKKCGLTSYFLFSILYPEYFLNRKMNRKLYHDFQNTILNLNINFEENIIRFLKMATQFDSYLTIKLMLSNLF